MSEGYPVNDPSEDILLMQIERCEEARATQDAELLALRAGLEQAVDHELDTCKVIYPFVTPCWLHKLLTDSAPAAREIEQRIAAEAVKQLVHEFSTAAERWHNKAKQDRHEIAVSSILDTNVPSHVLSTVRAQIWEAAAEQARALTKASESTPE